MALASAVCASVACAGEKHASGDGGGTASNGEYALCDGSDEIRLGVASDGGALDTAYELTNPYGHSFLFIDGHCHYYASASGRIVTQYPHSMTDFKNAAKGVDPSVFEVGVVAEARRVV